MVKIQEITGNKDLKKFIDVAWEIYRYDRNWVPPLKGQLQKSLQGVDNPLFAKGPHTFFMAWKNEKPAGRIAAGINLELNREKSKKEGYITLFECIDDSETAEALFNAASKWLQERGMESVTGPVSHTGGDDTRGVLVEGFDGSPVLMNSYNHPYYEKLYTGNGFRKEMDLFAFYLDVEKLNDERYGRVAEYAMRKFNFRIDRFDKRKLEREVKDIKHILDLSMPDTWEHLTPPALEDIRKEFKALVKFLDRDLVYIARSGEAPVGFIVALPDYNQVLKKLNGKLLPFGFVKYLWYKRKINGARIFIQFVIPAFRNKAVVNSIYYRLMKEGRKKGYIFGEGSTIAEMNKESIRNVEGLGGKLYRVYRIYRKVL